MSWTFTTDVESYDRAAGELLRRDPARHTISLTVIETARARGYENALYGWWTGPDGRVTGAVSHTPPFPLLLAEMPDEAIRPLATELQGRDISGVNAMSALAAQFAVVWTPMAGGRAVVRNALRLFRLDSLQMPDVPGRARRATDDDIDLLDRWAGEFARDIGEISHGPVGDRLSYGGWMLWEDPSGRPVSMAGRTRTAAGVARVAPVYTPPGHRRNGYAAGVTAAVSADALEHADEVVLFTELNNPTSNALYRRLGYEPVTDRLALEFIA
jgi:RimJ/RimL family protein N-acetyltransferase